MAKGPIKVEDWRGEDGEMRKWMAFALAGEGDAHGALLRVVEFADRMFGMAKQEEDPRSVGEARSGS